MGDTTVPAKRTLRGLQGIEGIEGDVPVNVIQKKRAPLPGP